jgi:hypothetical protein
MRLVVAEKIGCEPPPATERVTLDQSRELP